MRVRHSEASLSKAREKADGISEKMRQISAFLDGFDAKFWAGVTERVTLRMTDLRERREATFGAMSESEIKANVAAEKELRGVIELPIRAREKLQDLRKEHGLILDGINERVSKG